MNLPTHLFDGDIQVQTLLCQPDKTIIGEIQPYDYNGNFKFNTYSEISFTIDRLYNDLIDGEVKVNPYYDLIESLRAIYIRGVGHFVIQDVSDDLGDKDSKSVTCFSLEYATGNKYLESFYVNTGEDASVEVMVHSQQFGIDYTIDDTYTKDTSHKFDPFQRYYIKRSANETATRWNYEEQQVVDEHDYSRYTGLTAELTLYVRKFPNVRFYWPTRPELSLLHLVFDRIPEWKIGHVDKELWYQERTFSEDRTAVYDFLYNNAAETLDFVMVWDSINGTCSFYKTTEDGVTADEEIETQWNTDVFISKENLAQNISIKYSTDDIKTKLKITGNDDLEVRDVNLGQNYIMNLSYYNTSQWFGEDLHLKYNQYTANLEEYTKQYAELMSEWMLTYHEHSDLMNYVPVDPSVLLIGDLFDKLHCVYSKYVPATKYEANTTYYSDRYGTVAETQPTADTNFVDEHYYIVNINTQVTNLRNKLKLYKVDKDNNGNWSTMDKTDDVLLTLTNANSDSITIRVKYDTTENDYMVYRIFTSASTGIINTKKYTLNNWVDGILTAEYIGAEDSTVKSIGTLGAFLCIAKDETQEENIEDYGIKLLETKRDTYTKIFITQTEGYMNKEGAQCVASDEAPDLSEVAVGTKWLDTDSDPLYMAECITQNSQKVWKEYTPENNQADYENYARFDENYRKLQTVNKVLSEKQDIANYLSDGFGITTMYLTEDKINLNNLLQAAVLHFIALDNDIYFTETDEDLSTEDINEGSIWFRTLEYPLGLTIWKYTNGEWILYNPGIDITLNKYDKDFGYITFEVSTDADNEYAVYVDGGTPYVSYARSKGLNTAKRNKLKELSDMNAFFDEHELVRLSPFIREDEFSDSNFLLTTYESEEEEMYVKQELLKAGQEELAKICQPKFSFDATMANILAIPEFAPIKNQFKLGNFIRVGIRDNYVKRARLLEVGISFDNEADFTATFGDLISTKSEIDKHADLLKQAVTVSKSVASNQSKWQKGADKATELDKAIADGLRDAALSIGSANGQAITWDQYGIRGRKLVDGTTDQYEPEQFAIINNKLAFTSDNWKTSKSIIGKYTINGEDRWGPLAEYVTATVLEGKEIKGGSIEIGTGDTKFVVNENGEVSIMYGGNEKYATTSAMDAIDQAYRYSVSLSYSGPTVFATKDDAVQTTITATVYDRGVDITNKFSNTAFNWIRSSGDAEADRSWNAIYANKSNVITINHNHVIESSHFSCQVDLDKMTT